MTEGHGELCEACQKEVQQEGQPAKPPNRKRLAGEI